MLVNPPALLVVQGDTSSAMGAALAGFAAAIPVAHVEAGLRSFDPAMPWPEEEYRTAIDARAALLFAPTTGNAANLRGEGVPGEIHVTGNSGVDALFETLKRLPPKLRRRAGPLNLLVTCHRRENWGKGLESVAAALRELATAQPLSIRFVLSPNATVAAAMRALLVGVDAARLVEPLGHAAMIAAMREADIILSDSGGMQEEAPVLGVPLLVLRDKTERPEGIASGNMLLVGTDAVRIRDSVTRLRDPAVRASMSTPAFPFGDGHAAPRIAARIKEYVERNAEPDWIERRA